MPQTQTKARTDLPSAEAAPRRKVAQSSAPKVAERLSSSERLVSEIRQGLYGGRYVPGQLLTEAELARRFGVGRGTVREALKQLAAEGIVTVSLYSGARIRSFTRKDVQDVLEVTEALVALAVRRAATRTHSKAEIEMLQSMLGALEAPAVEWQAQNPDNPRRLFYRKLAQISGNRELENIILTVQSDLIRMQFRPAFKPELDVRHAKIYGQVLEAILGNDVVKAERTIRKHIRSVSQVVDSLPDHMFAY